MTRALVFEPRSVALAVGRSLVAVAGLVLLVLTPDDDLFPGVRGGPSGLRCTGLSSVSLWCVGSGALPMDAARAVAVVVLLIVASGYRPRWTCVPHWYVTASLGLATSVTNGGEQAARLLTLLLIPLCLGDRRRWQWTTRAPALPPVWRGSGYAGHLAIRMQVVLIYGDAVVAKVREPEWLDGTAMHYIVQNAYFGAATWLVELLGSPLLDGWSIRVVTWASLALEAFIAVSALGAMRIRRWGLVAGIGLHGAIMVALGLIGFGLIMIALLCAAYGGRAVRTTSTGAAAGGAPHKHVG